MTKKRNYFVFILSIIIMLGSFGLTSCGDDGDSNPVDPLSDRERAFVGNWTLTKVTVTDNDGTRELTPQQAGIAMTFNVRSDMTYSASVTESGETINDEGTWSLNGSIIVLQSSQGPSSFMNYTVDGDTFTITVETFEGDVVISSELREFTKS